MIFEHLQKDKKHPKWVGSHNLDSKNDTSMFMNKIYGRSTQYIFYWLIHLGWRSNIHWISHIVTLESSFMRPQIGEEIKVVKKNHGIEDKWYYLDDKTFPISNTEEPHQKI